MKKYSNEPNNLIQHLQKVAWEVLTAFLPALLIALFIHVQVAKAVEIKDGPSMQPNLYKGYRVMIEKVSYRFHLPRRGDIVVVDRPAGEVALIKRVMGLPGETVEVRTGHVMVDGQKITEPWIVYFGGSDYGPAKIPDGYVFVVGDNRPDSRDSRAIGPAATRTIEGRVWLIYWPLDKIGLVP